MLFSWTSFSKEACMVAMKTIAKRCAIYTRKSTEEGLEQDFNSLDAQREACAAYVTSQKCEGWLALAEQYDDGGYSGGTIERPGLKRLIADIKARKVDIVVVYKIDRLTRSLLDFSKLVEIFDQYGVTFVSVTQSFNTTTSMGRLTLNVLLSFAQFEREVTGERIRDKIAASKKKGLWMGGVPPLGYDIDNLVLQPKAQEVGLARYIFERYLELKSVGLLKQDLEEQTFLTPIRISKKGKAHGGAKFSRGALYAILKNPAYIGKIGHKGKIYDGQHKGIIDADTWQEAQDLLEQNRVHRTETTRSRHALQGLVFDPEGTPYSPTFTKKKERRYCYYISQNLLQYEDHPNKQVERIPAHEIEGVVYKAIWKNIPELIQGTSAHILEHIIKNEQSVTADNFMRKVVKKVTVGLEDLTIEINLKSLKEVLDNKFKVSVHVDGEAQEIIWPYKIAKGKKGTLIIQSNADGGDPLDMPPEQLQRLVQGIAWRDEYFEGMTLKEIAAREKCSDSYVSKCIKQSFEFMAA